LTIAIELKNPEPSTRLLYQEWVEDQVEGYKDGISRSDLLRIAEEAVDEIRINRRGQYQLTEVLLCAAVDRKIFELLNLPVYSVWCRTRGHEEPADVDEPLLPMP
jgi:hypothetical protein